MVDKDAVRRGYDDAADAYAAARDDEGRDVDLLEEFLGQLPPTARLLDVGCGGGRPVLSRAGDTAAVGVDISRTQLERAARTAPGVPLVQADMTSLPVRDGSFDAVTAYHSLIHVPIDDHRAVVEEFARVLRPGGRALLSEGPDEWHGTNPDWLESGVEMQWHIAGADATRGHLRDAGFEVLDERGTTHSFDGDDERWVYFDARLDA